MKALAIIFFVVGLVAFFVTADCRWGFVPLQLQGPEAGLIVGALALFLGLLASLLASLFAFIALQGAKATKGPRILLGSSCLLLLGFVIVLVS